MQADTTAPGEPAGKPVRLAVFYGTRYRDITRKVIFRKQHVTDNSKLCRTKQLVIGLALDSFLRHLLPPLSFCIVPQMTH